MKENPVTVPPETPVLDAIALMRREKLAYLLVVKDSQPGGHRHRARHPQYHRPSSGAASGALSRPRWTPAARRRRRFSTRTWPLWRRSPGPLVICIGGMHGNEPAGVFAAQRVVRALKSTAHRFGGRWWRWQEIAPRWRADAVL